MPSPRSAYDQMMENDHASQWLGLEPVLIEEGHCQLRMVIRREMLNGFGILHGGMAYALADSALAFAANSYGRLSVTIQGSINFAQSAREGDVLIADARVLQMGHRTGDIDVNIYLEEHPTEVYYRLRGTVYRSSKTIG